MVLREKPQIKFLYYLEGGGHDRFSTLAHHSSWPQTRQLAQERGGGGGGELLFFFSPQNLLLPGLNPRSTVLRPKMWQLLTFTSTQNLEVCN